MWADYFLRPSGEVVVVGEDYDHPDVDAVHTDRSNVLRALVWGSRRYPALRELLPARPPGAVDCRCRQIPVFAEGKVLCPECGALGWLPPQLKFPTDRGQRESGVNSEQEETHRWPVPARRTRRSSSSGPWR